MTAQAHNEYLRWRRRRRVRNSLIATFVLVVWAGVVTAVVCECPPWLARSVCHLRDWHEMSTGVGWGLGSTPVYKVRGALSYDAPDGEYPVGLVEWRCESTDKQFQLPPLVNGNTLTFNGVVDLHIFTVQCSHTVVPFESTTQDSMEEFVRNNGLRIDRDRIPVPRAVRPSEFPWVDITGDGRLHERTATPTWRVLWIAMPRVMGIALIGAIVAMTAWAARRLPITWYRHRNRLCPRCAYPAHPNTCPECGLTAAFEAPRA